MQSYAALTEIPDFSQEVRRDTYARISLPAIRHNIRAIRRLLPARTTFMAVVKANAYGHGAVAVAREALRSGAEQLAAAYLSEAIELRDSGITAPILILTPVHPAEAALAVKFNLMLTVPSAAWLWEVRRCKPASMPGKLRLHIKLDTGLGRIGIRSEEEWKQLEPLLRADDIAVEGVFTHFATAGQADSSYLEQQYDRFAEMAGWIRECGIKVKKYHCAGSAAALRGAKYAMDMVRIGAAMYGFAPQQLLMRQQAELQPALELHSRLIQVKRVRRGETIGYDGCYRAECSEWVGTVPIGYADGWNQSLRTAEVLIGGRRAAVVGKICMDQLMVRLPRYAAPGTAVTLIGGHGGERVTCAELAQNLGGSPQEISSALSARVPRIY